MYNYFNMFTGNRKYIVGLSVLLGAFASLAIAYVIFFGFFKIPEPGATKERFVVELYENNMGIASLLVSQGFVGHPVVFSILSFFRGSGFYIAPGAYSLSRDMTIWQILGVLREPPYMRWVVIREGLRKEEIAQLFVKSLGWTPAQVTEWTTKATVSPSEYFEGVYFPNTYLIPVAETPAQVAARLQVKFEEQFAPLAKEAIAQNIKWTVVVNLASLVQREAAGKSDMALIAGILWNRLEQKMPLGVDATIQYLRGDTGKGWWAPIASADTKIASPYNTYLHAGLPPHPIANPGLDAMRAVLAPTKTDCLYYIHDTSRVIHCAVTFDEHKQNIEKYLR
jgi:UPF0755 protein